jgi:hypothetical protein
MDEDKLNRLPPDVKKQFVMFGLNSLKEVITKKLQKNLTVWQKAKLKD